MVADEPASLALPAAVQKTLGRPRLELRKSGTFLVATDVEISEGATTTLELRLRTPPPAS